MAKLKTKAYPPLGLTYFYLFHDRGDEIAINNNVIYLIKLGTTNKESLKTPPKPPTIVSSLTTTVKDEDE